MASTNPLLGGVFAILPYLALLFWLDWSGWGELGTVGMMFTVLAVATLFLVFVLLRALPLSHSLSDPAWIFPQGVAGLLLMVVLLSQVDPTFRFPLLLAALPWAAVHGLPLGSLRCALLVILTSLAYLLLSMFLAASPTAVSAMPLAMEVFAFLLAGSALLIALVALELKGAKRDAGSLRRNLEEIAQPRLLNRDELVEVMSREVARAQRKKGVFSVAVLAVDERNKLHLERGQAAVDALDRAFARCMLERARQMDVVGQRNPGDGPIGAYQGEEFVAILPATPLRGAISFGNRIRYAMEHLTLRFQGNALSGTISAGVAEYRQGESIGTLLTRAESALYRAQRLGRNRVEKETAGDATVPRSG